MKVKATVAGSVDVAAVEAHIERFVVSCPLCKAVGQLGVAQHVCGIEACDGTDDSIHAVMIVCKRCGYLIPLSAEHITSSAEKAA
jgi:C4-type Zn-finger protein